MPVAVARGGLSLDMEEPGVAPHHGHDPLRPGSRGRPLPGRPGTPPRARSDPSRGCTRRATASGAVSRLVLHELVVGRASRRTGPAAPPRARGSGRCRGTSCPRRSASRSCGWCGDASSSRVDRAGTRRLAWTPVAWSPSETLSRTNGAESLMDEVRRASDGKPGPASPAPGWISAVAAPAKKSDLVRAVLRAQTAVAHAPRLGSGVGGLFHRRLHRFGSRRGGPPSQARRRTVN